MARRREQAQCPNGRSPDVALAAVERRERGHVVRGELEVEDARFSRMPPGSADFGTAISPSCMCQRSTTCAGVRPWRSARRAITGSRQQVAALAQRADDSVTMPCSAWYARGLGADVPRVELDWLTSGTTPGLGEQPLRCAGLKFESADGAQRALLQQREEAPPGVDVAVLPRVGPVDQQQVDVVDAELVERSSERLRRRRPAVPWALNLRGDEQLLARHARGPHAPPDAALVAVRLGRVEEPVAASMACTTAASALRRRPAARCPGRAVGSRRRARGSWSVPVRWSWRGVLPGPRNRRAWSRRDGMGAA